MKMNSIFNIENKRLIRILFALLFLYLILRAIFVEPLLDELGTLHWYIETGNIINENAVLDANNHLLNSYFSHYAFRFFGDHLIVYRLLALISFPIYFFSAKKLVVENIKQFPFVVFLALISIHWVFDYFSLSRGYAPSVAFFMLGLSYISAWNKGNTSFHLAIILVSFTLSLLANLSMLVPVLLLFGYLHFTLFIQWKKRSWTKIISVYILSFGFLIVVFKLYEYVSKLKAAGALWWGSKSGLWEVTGKSVSENIFFTHSNFILYGCMIVFVLLTILYVRLFFKKGVKEYMLSIQFWTFSLLISSLISAVFLAKFMDINYPQDRVAMYLVILLIVSMGSLLSTFHQLKWGLLLLLWFPISFISKVNLNTTIFSPQDRIHTSFYTKILKIVEKDDVLTADYVAHMCYAYASRTSPSAKMAVLNESEKLSGEDFHLTSYYGKVKNWSNYTCVLNDPITKMKLYKRNSTQQKTTLLSSTLRTEASNEMYLNLLKYQLPDSVNFSAIQVTVEGRVALKNGSLSLNLIQDIPAQENGQSNYNSTLFNWYFGKKRNYVFNYSRRITFNELKDKTLTIYVYNPELENVELSDFRIKLIGINKINSNYSKNN